MCRLTLDTLKKPRPRAGLARRLLEWASAPPIDAFYYHRAAHWLPLHYHWAVVAGVVVAVLLPRLAAAVVYYHWVKVSGVVTLHCCHGHPLAIALHNVVAGG
jgi:hypothetical protein